MKDKSKLLAILLVIITVLVVGISFIIDRNKEKEEKEINIVTNYSNFYTVASCISRTFNYISASDSDNLLLIINDKYKKQNNITKDNVLSLFSMVNETSSFNPRKMYYQKINKNLTKYYVYGYLEQVQFVDDYVNSLPTRIDMYFIVYLDSNKGIFSIEPYSGEVFMDGDNNAR